jgi:hypothetical protein
VHAMISPYSRSPGQATNRVRLPANPIPPANPLPPKGKRTGPLNRADPADPASWPEGKGPGRRLRTGVRPVGNGLGLRCLLGARTPSTSNPPSSRISAAGPLSPFPYHVGLGGGWMLTPPAVALLRT